MRVLLLAAALAASGVTGALLNPAREQRRRGQLRLVPFDWLVRGADAGAR